MADTKQVALEILKTLSLFCEEEGIRYFLVFGTLIGAIRHKGFIPWDDDVDIMMPRPDHDRFVQRFLARQNEFPFLKLFTPNTNPDYPYMITRVSDDRYRIVMDNEKPYGMGIFIDIYPYDGLGDCRKEALKLVKKSDRLSSLCFQASRLHLEKGITKSLWKKLIKFPVFVLCKLIGKDFFMDKLRRMEGAISYDSSKYVGNVVWASEGDVSVYDRQLFEDSVMVEFEGELFRAPVGYDHYLRQIYGNYMELPPEKEREPRHNYYVIKNPTLNV